MHYTYSHLYIHAFMYIYTYTHVHTHMLTHASVHAHMQQWAGHSVLQVPIYGGCGHGADQPLLAFLLLATVPDELVDGKARDAEAGHASNDNHHAICPAWVWDLLGFGKFLLWREQPHGEQTQRQPARSPSGAQCPLLPKILTSWPLWGREGRPKAPPTHTCFPHLPHLLCLPCLLYFLCPHTFPTSPTPRCPHLLCSTCLLSGGTPPTPASSPCALT